MDIQLVKPNKSTPYWRIHIANPIGVDVSNQPKLKKSVSIYFTKKQLEEFKDFLKLGGMLR